jgi:hypothetical protein
LGGEHSRTLAGSFDWENQIGQNIIEWRDFIPDWSFERKDES